MSIPPEVAADLTAPDGRRPNHYALRTDQAAPAAVGGAKGGAETAARRPTGATGAADRTGDGR